MRVLHVVVAGAVGGAERVVADLARRPEETRAEHAVALITPEPALTAFFRDAGVPLDVLPRRREGPLSDLTIHFGAAARDFVADCARRHRAALLHLHTFGSHVVGARAAAALGVPFVRTEHSTRAYRDPSCWPLSRGSLARAAAVVAVSEHVRRVASRRTRRALVVVRNGVDTAHFAPRPYPSGEARFAVVGRLDRRKGVDRAIAAAARVSGCVLDIVGDGPARARLEALARRLGVGARFHGFLADPRPVVAAAGAVVAASREEALSVALLEGMALGRPAVAMPVGGIPEIVREGVTGLLAARPDVGALAERLREAAADRAGLERLGASARRFVETEASIGAMCRGYAEVYDAVTRDRALPTP